MMKPRYLIVGSGQVARHFDNYLTQLKLEHFHWARSQSKEELKIQLKKCTHVLLLVSDSAIETFYRENLAQCHIPCIHFSGALDIPDVFGAHPLMSFGPESYVLETYKKIPFVLTSGSLAELLPGLPNPSFLIEAQHKALYHALCVLGGNFSLLLWQKMQDGFEQLGLPKEVSYPYLEQILQNFKSNSGVTGPLARKDVPTIKKNLNALSSDPYQKIYQDFSEIMGVDL